MRKNNVGKILISIMLTIFLLLNFSYIAYADDISTFLTDLTTRWVKYPTDSHMGTKSTTFKYESDTIKTTYESNVTNGISMWGTAINCTYSNTSNKGLIKASAIITTATAATDSSYNSSTLHITNWSITIYSNQFDGNVQAGKERTIAHEIGHVYGLHHFSNSSQIMYDTYSTTKSVTSYDISGMNVMTHTHTHDGTYSKTYEAYSNSEHKVRCSTCKSYKLGECTYTMYHSGTKHYLKYNCVCGNTYSTSWNCSGPPCITPYFTILEFER